MSFAVRRSERSEIAELLSTEIRERSSPASEGGVGAVRWRRAIASASSTIAAGAAAGDACFGEGRLTPTITSPSATTGTAIPSHRFRMPSFGTGGAERAKKVASPADDARTLGADSW